MASSQTTSTAKTKTGETTAPKMVPLTSAPPPWHTQTIWLALLVLFVYLMPSLDKLDEVATVDTFTNRVFPDYLPLKLLAYTRLTFAAVIFATQAEFFVSGSTLQFTYLPGSKLIQTNVVLERFRTFWPFTCVTWNILGVSFTIAGYIALQQATDDSNVELSPWLLRVGIVTWAMTAPLTALVSIVVRYALWPTVLKQGNSTQAFRSLRGLLMHNFNIFSAVMELSLLGGLPVRWCDLSWSPLLGLAYVLATWCGANAWGICHAKYGPQYLYFFMDTTQPGFFPTTALLALLGVLLIFFALFASLESVLPLLPGGLLGHVVFVVAICAGSMKFRD